MNGYILAPEVAEAATAWPVELLGIYDNTDPRWHDLRATGIGGSEVGTICGLNKWESAFALWAKKSGKIDDDRQVSPAMEWGTRLETPILDKFEDEHPDLIVHRNVGTWRSTARPFQLANPDALFQASDGSWGVVEVKTARYPDDWANGVPVGYQAQVQWYLQTFGLRQAWVVVLFSGSDYQEFLIEADDFVQGVNLGMVEQFLTHLDQGTKPDWDGATSTLETQRKLHPEIDDTEVELGELGQALESALAAEKSVASATNVIKCQILDLMGTAKKGTIDGEWAFTRQAKGQGTPFLVAKRGK